MKKLLCLLGLLLIIGLCGCKQDGILISAENKYEEKSADEETSKEQTDARNQTDEKEQTDARNQTDVKNQTGTNTQTGAKGYLSSEKQPCIYLCGAVNNPGIYEIGNNTRLYEIVEAAGGLDEEADIDAINLAVVVKDEEQIRIPYIGETIVVEEDSRININTASMEELCKIPGIGESRAQAIIDYRESAGGFSTEEELMQISGIKSATYNKIKNYIRVK